MLDPIQCLLGAVVSERALNAPLRVISVQDDVAPTASDTPCRCQRWQLYRPVPPN